MYGHSVLCPINFARCTSDDIESLTRSLKAHCYDAMDWRIVSKFLMLEQDVRAGFWFLVQV
jgi:hypothetical protein